jgi:solute carrier family 38 (sodium-coupled neutral amino acid transporter), member 11
MDCSCSSVLPVPFAFSKIGVVTGLVTMAIVAYANELTSRLLTRAAAYSGKSSYEELAEWAGGRRWKVSPLIGCSDLYFPVWLADRQD